jgi:hypothetical protein
MKEIHIQSMPQALLDSFFNMTISEMRRPPGKSWKTSSVMLPAQT